jgi:hypothetical protein
MRRRPGPDSHPANNVHLGMFTLVGDGSHEFQRGPWRGLEEGGTGAAPTIQRSLSCGGSSAPGRSGNCRRRLGGEDGKGKGIPSETQSQDLAVTERAARGAQPPDPSTAEGPRQEPPSETQS